MEPKRVDFGVEIQAKAIRGRFNAEMRDAGELERENERRARI
jgi:hypothetical protein